MLQSTFCVSVKNKASVCDATATPKTFKSARAPTPATPFDAEPALGAGHSRFYVMHAPAAPRKKTPKTQTSVGTHTPR
eukprot:15459151-Alexandrium_andersonii.AAC.1